MLDNEMILRYFSLFSDLEGEAAQPWRPLCHGAGRALEKRLRPGLEEPDEIDMERLCAAAAAMAFGDYLLLRGGGADEVRVGDISLRSAAGTVGRDARDIRCYFLEQAADLLLPGETALLGVES